VKNSWRVTNRNFLKTRNESFQNVNWFFFNRAAITTLFFASLSNKNRQIDHINYGLTFRSKIANFKHDYSFLPTDYSGHYLQSKARIRLRKSYDTDFLESANWWANLCGGIFEKIDSCFYLTRQKTKRKTKEINKVLNLQKGVYALV
jgi:hypothetical protein